MSLNFKRFLKTKLVNQFEDLEAKSLWIKVLAKCQKKVNTRINAWEHKTSRGTRLEKESTTILMTPDYKSLQYAGMEV